MSAANDAADVMITAALLARLTDSEPPASIVVPVFTSEQYAAAIVESTYRRAVAAQARVNARIQNGTK